MAAAVGLAGELRGGRLRRGAAGSEIQPYLEGGIEEAALSGGRRGDGLLGNAGANTGNAGSGDPAYRAALWAVGTVTLPGVCECFVSRRC